MSGPELPPSPEPFLSRREKEQLLQKMYALPHWIAIIRLFGYQTLSMDRARAAIKPIADEFGEEKTADACEVLVEIVPQKEPQARLKAHIRRMAFQILGPAKREQETATDVPEQKPKRAASHDSSSKPTSGPEGKPVKQPRHHVLKQCETWMNDAKLSFVAMDDVKRTTPAVAPFVGTLDFIVLRGEEKLLVTVRPKLQAKHLAAIGELQKLFGPEYRPVRIWPVDGRDEWIWQEHAID